MSTTLRGKKKERRKNKDKVSNRMKKVPLKKTKKSMV